MTGMVVVSVEERARGEERGIMIVSDDPPAEKPRPWTHQTHLLRLAAEGPPDEEGAAGPSDGDDILLKTTLVLLVLQEGRAGWCKRERARAPVGGGAVGALAIGVASRRRPALPSAPCETPTLCSSLNCTRHPTPAPDLS
jgi:hypothetical protein